MYSVLNKIFSATLNGLFFYEEYISQSFLFVHGELIFEDFGQILRKIMHWKYQIEHFFEAISDLNAFYFRTSRLEGVL